MSNADVSNKRVVGTTRGEGQQGVDKRMTAADRRLAQQEAEVARLARRLRFEMLLLARLQRGAKGASKALVPKPAIGSVTDVLVRATARQALSCEEAASGVEGNGSRIRNVE